MLAILLQLLKALMPFQVALNHPLNLLADYLDMSKPHAGDVFSALRRERVQLVAVLVGGRHGRQVTRHRVHIRIVLETLGLQRSAHAVFQPVHGCDDPHAGVRFNRKCAPQRRERRRRLGNPPKAVLVLPKDLRRRRHLERVERRVALEACAQHI
eukprot:scaffold8194_cov248-Pinguiococcus_pyrenoidosus.AAC.7